MNILIKAFKIPFIVTGGLFIGILIFSFTTFLDLFNIAKDFFNLIKE
jgi:hypothetical protein